jgi:RNA polymerase sigma-70 factor, ECF subfamily
MSRFGALEARDRVTLALRLPRGPVGRGVLERAAVSVLSPPRGLAADPARGWSRTREPAVGDEALVAAVRAGDRGAEEQLYRRHAPSVLTLATRLLRSRDDAMDVLQDTFVTAFEDLAELREPAAFRGWVHRVAVRLVHRRFRKRRLLGILGLDRRGEEIPLDSLAGEAASPEARVELRWLDAALLRVDARARVAWMLRNIEGLALDEVAASCDCSLATVKRWIAAADTVVASHLEDRGSP